MPRKMVKQNWGPVPARRQIQGLGASELMDIDAAANQDVAYEDSGTNDGGEAEKLGTPQPDESFISKCRMPSAGKRFKGGGL